MAEDGKNQPENVDGYVDDSVMLARLASDGDIEWEH